MRLLEQIRRAPKPRTCEQVEPIGQPARRRARGRGVQTPLRVYLTCRPVGCCDSSRRHPRAHARKTAHPVIGALRSGFTYCDQHREHL